MWFFPDAGLRLLPVLELASPVSVEKSSLSCRLHSFYPSGSLPPRDFRGLPSCPVPGRKLPGPSFLAACLCARSTHGVHHPIVEVSIVIGVVLGDVHVARVVVSLVVHAVVGLTLGLIAHVVVVVFVVAFP